MLAIEDAMGNIELIDENTGSVVAPKDLTLQDINVADGAVMDMVIDSDIPLRIGSVNVADGTVNIMSTDQYTGGEVYIGTLTAGFGSVLNFGALNMLLI